MNEKEWWAEASKAAAYRHKVRESMNCDVGRENDLMMRDRQTQWNGPSPNAYSAQAGKDSRAMSRTGAESGSWIKWC